MCKCSPKFISGCKRSLLRGEKKFEIPEQWYNVNTHFVVSHTVKNKWHFEVASSSGELVLVSCSNH